MASEEDQAQSEASSSSAQARPSFLPVHKLPAELLVHIFSNFNDVCNKQTEDVMWLGVLSHHTPIRTGWLRLMSVCRYWRDALVSTPTFWRHIDLGRNAEWTRLCLGRSVPASVDVVAPFRQEDRLDVLHPHVHRFRTFVFGMGVKSTALPPLFSNGMPLLECLYFMGNGRGDHNLDVYFTSQRFPRLHTLVLSRIIIPQDISLYAQLQTLELNWCDHTLPFEGFLDALAASVRLEYLTINCNTLRDISSAEWTRNPGPLFRRVLLPRLRKFRLDCNSVAYTSRFLSHLYLQPSVVLKIGAADAWVGLHTVPGGDDSPEVPLSFSTMLPPDPFATLPSLTMATAVSMSTGIEHWEGRSVSELHYYYPSPVGPGAPPHSDHRRATAVAALSLELRRSLGDPFMCTALDDLVWCFRRSPLTYLQVKGNHAYGTVAAWAGVFRAFPLLQQLSICSGLKRPLSDVTAVFRGLHAASTSTHGNACSDGGAPGSVACANLQDVFVQGIGLVETYEALRECFRWRGERGVVVRVLNLTCLHDQDAAVADARSALREDLRGAVESLHVYSSL